jgi:hypothetical protein
MFALTDPLYDLGAWQCECCQRTDVIVVTYHQNTQYVDEASNWVTLCDPCRKENDEYWEAMWAEYYGGRL